MWRFFFFLLFFFSFLRALEWAGWNVDGRVQHHQLLPKDDGSDGRQQENHWHSAAHVGRDNTDSDEKFLCFVRVKLLALAKASFHTSYQCICYAKRKEITSKIIVVSIFHRQISGATLAICNYSACNKYVCTQLLWNVFMCVLEGRCSVSVSF